MPASFFGKIVSSYYDKNYLLIAKTSLNFPRLQMFITSQNSVTYIAFNGLENHIDAKKVAITGNVPKIYYVPDGNELNVYMTGVFGDICKIEHYNLIKKYSPGTKYTGKIEAVEALPPSAVEL